MVRIKSTQQSSSARQAQATQSTQKAKATQSAGQTARTAKAGKAAQAQGGRVDPQAARDFVKSATAQKTGAPAMNVRLGSASVNTDIRNRVHQGGSHEIKFGGLVMDRTLLAGLLDSMLGKGDGRISSKDVQQVARRLLDAGKITTAEENTLLFALKYGRFTNAADQALAQTIGKAFPDSAVARFGSLGQAPRFKGYEQYDLPMFAGRSADLYGAKAVMTEKEMGSWQAGEMSLAQFNAILMRANQPMSADGLRKTFGEWTSKEAEAAMTPAETKQFKAGKMNAAEFQNIQYRSWEDANPSMKGRTPYQADYAPGFKPFVSDDVQDPKVKTIHSNLANFNAQLAKGDVEGMLAVFDKAIVKEQVGFLVDQGLKPAAARQQFLLEALGLTGVSNTRDIEQVTLNTAKVEAFGPNSFQVKGSAILKDGTSVPVNLLLNKDHTFTSAVG